MFQTVCPNILIFRHSVSWYPNKLKLRHKTFLVLYNNNYQHQNTDESACPLAMFCVPPIRPDVVAVPLCIDFSICIPLSITTLSVAVARSALAATSVSGRVLGKPAKYDSNQKNKNTTNQTLITQKPCC